MKLKNENYLKDIYVIDFISEILEYENNSFIRDEIVYLLFQKITVGNKSLNELFELLNLKKAFDYVIDLAKNEHEISERLICEINRILLIDIIPAGIYRTNNNLGGVNYLEIKEQMDYLIDDFLNSETLKSGEWFFENFMEIKPFNHRNLATAAILYLFITLKEGEMPKLISEL